MQTSVVTFWESYSQGRFFKMQSALLSYLILIVNLTASSIILKQVCEHACERLSRRLALSIGSIIP